MTVVDFIIVVFLVFFLVQGLWKGFLMEAFSILALALGLIAATNYQNFAAEQLLPLIGVETVARAAGFAVVYVIVWLPIKFMGWSLKRNHTEKESHPLSRFSGGLLGLAKGIFLVSLIVASAEHNFPHNKITGPNLLTPKLVIVADWCYKHAPFIPHPDEFQNMIRKSMQI